MGTTYGVHGEVLSKPPQGPKHTSHRAPKKTRKHKHLVLKWVLGIFAALVNLPVRETAIARPAPAAAVV